MKHICAQPIMKFYHRKYMLQKKTIKMIFLTELEKVPLFVLLILQFNV